MIVLNYAIEGIDWIGRARTVRELLKRFEKCEENVREKPF